MQLMQKRLRRMSLQKQELYHRLSGQGENNQVTATECGGGGQRKGTLWCHERGLMPGMRGAGEDEAHEPRGAREVPGQEGEAGARAAGAQDGQDGVQVAAADQECMVKCEDSERRS